MTEVKARGLDFTRAIVAIAKADGRLEMAADIAAREYGPADYATLYIKGAIGAAYTQGTTDWTGSKIAETVGYEFISLVNEISIVGRIGARPAPLNVKLAGIGTGASANWTGQAKPSPVTSIAFSSATLPPLSVTALAVLTKEIITMGAPGGLMWIRDELIRACVKALDEKFMSDDSAVSNVSPAGILDGVTDVEATTDVAYDLRALVADFDGDLTRAVFVAKPEIFCAIQSFQHQYCGARGGELLTLPCVASRYAPAQTLTLVDGSGIALGDSGVEVDIAEHASVEMLDGSLQQNGATGGTGTGVAMLSLWQNDAIGIRIIRHMNWAAMRPSVSYLSGVAYEEVSA